MSICPICRSTSFKPYNGRPDAQCVRCKSLERTRWVYFVLEAKRILRPSMRILHVAPEPALMTLFHELSGPKYHAVDATPENYGKCLVPIRRLDLCVDLEKLPSDCYDLVIHNHVLEHVHCSYEHVLAEITRLMAPGGHHVFTVPFRGSITRENVGPMSDAERVQQFAQADHMRLFGTEEFPALLKRLYGTDRVLVEPRFFLTRNEYRQLGLPEKCYKAVDGQSVFYWNKPYTPDSVCA